MGLVPLFFAQCEFAVGGGFDEPQVVHQAVQVRAFDRAPQCNGLVGIYLKSNVEEVQGKKRLRNNESKNGARICSLSPRSCSLKKKEVLIP